MDAPEAARPVRVGRGWPRAAVLLGASLSFTGFLGVAYLTMLAGLPAKRRSPWPWVTALGMAALVAFGPRTPLWWAERGWGLVVGVCFVAITRVRPGTGFVSRGLGALAGGAAVVAVALLVRGGLAAAIEAEVAASVHAQMVVLEQAFRDGVVDPATFASVERWQLLSYPAFLALTSLSALGVAWWFHVRMGQGSDQGLLPLREFRFNDHLVWLLIGGAVLLLAGVRRAGVNALLFMGVLYAVRGAAVAAFFGVGSTMASAFFLMIALLLAYPALLVGAFVIGLGDTWLDLRGKVRAMTGVS